MQPNSPYPTDPNRQVHVPPQTQAQQPVYPHAAPQPTIQPHEYEFIMNPQTPKRPPLKLPGGNSVIGRIVIMVVGLIVLLMIFTVLKSVFNRKPDLTPFVGIAQDQQELVHIASGAATQADISQTNKNIAVTANLTFSSDQAKVLGYLQTNGVTFNPKTFPTTLNARIDLNTDNTLNAAAGDNTYNSVFRTTMQEHITTYMQHLKQVYSLNKGKVGRQILNDEYNNADKLLKQVSSDSTN